MGRCLLTLDGFARVRELLPSTLVGRSPRCDLVIPSTGIPAYWMEIRWLGSEWGWRELTPLDSLRASGEPLPSGWRALRTNAGTARGTRLRWGTSGADSLELVDALAPGNLVIDLATNEPSPEGLRLVERRVDGTWLLDGDAQPCRTLAPDEVFVANGRAWRLVQPGAPADTLRLPMTIGQEGLGIGCGPTRATIRVGARTVAIEGEFVRTLYIYVTARRDDPDGGWLSVRDAYARWLAAGGFAGSGAERMGWDRGKIRTALAEAGVGGTSELFEVRRSDGETLCRITIPGTRLELV